jgi:hypothetical protein
MAVDGVKGKSGSQDTVQRQAEEYRNRETEQKRANEAQLKRIKAENEAKLKNQAKKSDNQIAAFRNEANRMLSKKDKDYQSEINELNRMHKTQTRRMAAESDRSGNLSTRSRDEAMNHTVDQKNEQMQSLKDSYEGYIDKQDDKFSSEFQRLRDKVQEDVAQERDEILEKNDKDRRDQDMQRRNEVASIQRAKEIQRRQKDAQIAELKDKFEMDRRTLTDRFENSLKDLQTTSTNRSKTQKEGFDASLDNMREEMYELQGKREETSAQNIANLRDLTNKRTINQINRLERELSSAKNNHIEDSVATKVKAREEREKILDSVRDRQNLMEENRLKALTDSNSRNQEAVEKMYKKNSELMGDQSSYYRGKINSLEMVKDEQGRQKATEFEARVASQENMGKIHAEKLKNKFQMEKREMEERFRSLVSQMRRNHSEQILNVKNKSMKEQGEVISNMDKVMKETEVKSEKALAEAISKYETKIADLTFKSNANLIKERETAEDRVKATEVHWGQKMEAQKLQFENQFSQLKEKTAHQEEQQRKRLEKLQADVVRSGKA